MNILMLNPPFHPKYSRGQRSPAVIKSGTVYYPIWLSYATGVLEQNGFNVKLVDAPAAGHDLSYVLDLVDQFQPRLVVMDTSTPSVYNDVEVAQAIKARAPGVFVVFVGPHVTALPEETLRISPAIDAVVRGEYDYTIRDLALAVQSGADWDSVLGLTYRRPAARSVEPLASVGCRPGGAGGSGEVVSNPDRPFIANLDGLPFVSEVYKRHLNVRNYFYSITQYPEVTIITGRGCPYKCIYCMWPQTLNGHGYRRRSVENVADEFEFIKRELPQVKEVFIEDDTLTVHQRRAVALGQELARRGVNLSFTANSRADVSYETLYWLKRGGLRLLCVGFESGDQAVLDAMRKQIKVEQFYQFRRDAARAGVMIHGCFMAGNPGETKETLAKTLQLAKELNPDTAQFFPLMVYPGTEAYEWAKRNGYLTTQDFRGWLTEDGLHKSVVSKPGLTSQDLVEWCDQARREFYLRPGYIWAKVRQVITQPREARRIFKSFCIFVKYLIRPSLRAETNV